MANPFLDALYRLKAAGEHFHLVHYIYGIGATVIGRMEGVGWFWILTLVPLTIGLSLAIQAEWFSDDDWWWPFDWPWWGSIPLGFAAKRAFKRLDGTEWVRFALDQKTEIERIDMMATYLKGEVKISGRKPPGEYRFIPENPARHGLIHGGGETLHMFGNREPLFQDLRIERSDFWWALRSMKRQSAGLA